MTPRPITISTDEDVASLFVLATTHFIRDFRRRNRFHTPDAVTRLEQVVEDIRRQIIEMHRGAAHE
jgi:hypothetical protein